MLACTEKMVDVPGVSRVHSDAASSFHILIAFVPMAFVQVST
jgi:hypothetical protein